MREMFCRGNNGRFVCTKLLLTFICSPHKKRWVGECAYCVARPHSLHEEFLDTTTSFGGENGVHGGLALILASSYACNACSGIHRSLGVHISKVRSATLDTWLLKHVAFIQCKLLLNT